MTKPREVTSSLSARLIQDAGWMPCIFFLTRSESRVIRTEAKRVDVRVNNSNNSKE